MSSTSEDSNSIAGLFPDDFDTVVFEIEFGLFATVKFFQYFPYGVLYKQYLYMEHIQYHPY